MISEVNHARLGILVGIETLDLAGDAEVPAAGTLKVLVEVPLDPESVAVDIRQSSAGTVDFGEILRIFGAKHAI